MAKNVDGAEEIAERLKKIEVSATNEIEQGLLNCALLVERDYKLNVNKDDLVDSGLWINTITHEADDFGTENPSVQVGSTIKDPPYPKFHEFGTSKFPAKYPLTRAFTKNKNKILQEIAKALKEGCDL